MIDWITALKVPCTHTEGIFDGLVIEFDMEGNSKWESMKRLPVEGSFSSKVHIRTSSGTPGKHIEISGNPSKFMQGHNLFGSNSVRGMSAAMIRRIISLVPQLTPTDEDLARIDSGDYEISRVDIAETFRLPNRLQVRTAVATLAKCANLHHRPGKASLTGESTCYWGKNSRRWALKAYVKGDEIAKKGHELHADLQGVQGLIEYADTALRLELVLRGMQLRESPDGLHIVHNWGDNTAYDVFQSFMKKLNIAEVTMLKPAEIADLPARLKSIYQLWVDGHDIRAMYPKATFYRYRAELLKHGIEIANLHHEREASNVVPLGLILHAYPAGVPDWAVGTSYYFDPAAELAAA